MFGVKLPHFSRQKWEALNGRHLRLLFRRYVALPFGLVFWLATTAVAFRLLNGMGVCMTTSAHTWRIRVELDAHMFGDARRPAAPRSIGFFVLLFDSLLPVSSSSTTARVCGCFYRRLTSKIFRVGGTGPRGKYIMPLAFSLGTRIRPNFRGASWRPNIITVLTRLLISTLRASLAIVI